MKRKQGISLIVLVITIIVMIILAAAVVITLSNTGIINKANYAVKVTNIKEAEQLASLAWAEAYAGGAREQEELQAAVDAALLEAKVDTSKYNIVATTTGVSVTENTSSEPLQEYVYVYSNGKWSEKLAIEDNSVGDVIVKFTKTGEQTTEKTFRMINEETPITIPAGEAYEMVIECKTEIGELYDSTTGEVFAWQKETNDYLEGKTDSCVLPYITTAIITGDITTMPEGMFYGAVNLKEVTLPDTITTIPGMAFMSCENLKTINWPANLETIGAYSFCLVGIEEITLPSKVKMIETEAFSGNKALKTVTLSENVTKIGIQAFLECSNLKTVNILSEVLTTVESDCFSDIASDAVIYVPNETIKQLFIDNQYSNLNTTIEVKK